MFNIRKIRRITKKAKIKNIEKLIEEREQNEVKILWEFF